MSVGIVPDQGDAANMKHTLRECKDHCTLADYYLNKLKAAPGVLKCIMNGKLVLAGKDSGVQRHIKQATDFSYSIEAYLGLHYCIISDAFGVFLLPAHATCH